MEDTIFKDLNISEEILKAVTDMGFEELTPIQSLAIPHILEGKDVLGQAQTGTGKTCAFGIPAIEMVDAGSEEVQVLIICPTRELAIQISEELKHVSKYKSNIGILPIYGGQPIDRQIYALKKKPQIIIGTPGRIMDHLRRKTLKLAGLKMVILDEADEMLNMGFREDIDTILEKVPEEKQIVLFSATMPKEILELTKKYQKEPVYVKATHKELTVPSIEQYYLEVSEASKLEVLSRLIDTNDINLALVFCNTKKRVDEVASSLQTRGYSAEALHGDMRQEQRDRVMNKFRKGKIDILIATDVAARGIDVDDVEAVFNYDIPNDEEYYVHRIGRTGRAGKTGKAFSFVVGREIYKLKDIKRYTKSNIVFMKPPTLMDVEEKKTAAILDKVKETLHEGDLSRYAAYINNVLEEANSHDGSDTSYITSMEIAAALLKMLSAQNSTSSDLSPEIDDVDAGAEKGMVRLFINIGRENKIQPRHIVESIASSTSLPGKLIGAIDIYDRYTFVEVPAEYAAEVLESMKNNTVRGKRINIERSSRKRVTGRKKA
ncbi:RNA helicase [Clostridium thermosuccinogenes]|uniref:ATP-dependent RNA helicase CshA n=1 Tax=Clostridium thermosuccinogenes TaxID=84032 RepID=A0A2K2F9R4_9CLOT|nr:DEAD/DEAH box helicase [Pseudoclostridium thermosuccinogenes]AUS95639.1 RNA helicase [Pseudoclostridium thermosuccinogenes]PNT95516.1 RNA helicase [Pseudoclostridium thermosuccinogenes]PNT96651.1 RNA helicase [Pseudoclostridium thermosuccinogenes]